MHGSLLCHLSLCFRRVMRVLVIHAWIHPCMHGCMVLRVFITMCKMLIFAVACKIWKYHYSWCHFTFSVRLRLASQRVLDLRSSSLMVDKGTSSLDFDFQYEISWEQKSHGTKLPMCLRLPKGWLHCADSPGWNSQGPKAPGLPRSWGNVRAFWSIFNDFPDFWTNKDLWKMFLQI